MIRLTLSQAARQLNARHLGAEAVFSSVSADSRTLRPGDLFIALKGPNFDGHDYLAQVAMRGAVAALVEREMALDLPLLLVTDSHAALGHLAATWRDAAAAPVVAVTGSNGKTTVKEMIAAILSQRGSVLATEGNLNNNIGLPLTLLRLQEEEYTVLEMGASHPGEIGYLSRIARPDVAVLNNAGRAHLEGFETLEGVARAKAEILLGLSDEGVFIFNADDRWASLWRELAGSRPLMTFGMVGEADVTSPEGEVDTRWDEAGFVTRFSVRSPSGEVELETALAGRHNRMNTLAATTAALALGLDLEEVRQGLAGMRPVKGRLQPLNGVGGVRLIDDSYNANPDSVQAAIDLLAAAPGRRFLVLGALAELGEGADRLYRQLGELAATAGIEYLYGIGAACGAVVAFGRGGRCFDHREALTEALHLALEPGDCALIKGSRRAGMEWVVDALAITEGGVH